MFNICQIKNWDHNIYVLLYIDIFLSEHLYYSCYYIDFKNILITISFTSFSVYKLFSVFHLIVVIWSLSHITFVTPWPVTCQAPLSIRFPRQEYWSRLPLPSPGDFSHPGIRHVSPALAGRFFITEPTGTPPSGLSFDSIIENTLTYST